MKDLKQFINESIKFDGSSKVSMGDSAALSKFIKDEVENLEGTVKVTGDGIKYDNILIPGTKLSLGLTADEYVDIFIDWLNDYNDKKDKANSKVVVKKSRAGNNYRGIDKEKMDARIAKNKEKVDQNSQWIR